MNKEIFLNDLRRFLSDIPQEEREQAIAYYEDYFEDAGPENEQRIIQELGSPVDIAKQIKMVNHENIEYGKGNTFNKAQAYPGVYPQNQQYYSQTENNNFNQNANQNASHADQQQAKKNWTENPSKVILVIILAILAVPVGIPVISALFGILIAILSCIFAVTVAFFGIGGSLLLGGIVTIVASFALVASGGFASTLFALGIGLILVAIGAFILWFGVLFCAKIVPAIFKCIKSPCTTICKKVKDFFQ